MFNLFKIGIALFFAWFLAYLTVTPHVPFVTLLLGWSFFLPFIVWSFLWTLPNAVISLAEVLKDANKIYAAEQVSNIAIFLAAPLDGLLASSPFPRGLTPMIRAMKMRSICLLYQGKFKEQFDADKQELDLLMQAGDYANAGAAAAKMASGYLKNGDLQSAEILSERALTLLKPAYERSSRPDNESQMERVQVDLYRSELASALFTRASIFEAQRRYAEAEPFRKEALYLLESKHGESNAITPHLTMLGSLYTRMGRLDEAERYLLRSLEIRQRELPKGHRLLGSVQQSLGKLYCLKGELLKAATYTEHAYTIAQHINDESPSPSFSEHLGDMGMLKYRQGKYDEAEDFFKQALGEKIKYYGESHPELLDILDEYRGLLVELGRMQEVEKLQEQANAIRLKYNIAEPARENA